ncbi:MAG: BACON domain-containing protein [Acidobacteria bacterium]|nr:BACON domain-containing protein [Acidobacteriota bacterium]
MTAAVAPGTLPASGGSATLTVSTTRDCAWDVASRAEWVTFTGTPRGQGEGEVAFRVSVNADPAVRQGTVVVNDAEVTVAQDGSPCRFSVTPAEANSPSTGGTLSFRVETGSTRCAWSATAEAAWLHADSAPHAGSGSTSVRVDSNSGAARNATMMVAGVSVSIEQDAVTPTTPVPAPMPGPGPTPSPAPSPTPTPTPSPAPSPTPGPSPSPTPQPPCTYTLSPSSAQVGAAGRTLDVSVATQAGCAWTVQQVDAWIDVSGMSTGTGSGSTRISVERNRNKADRTGTIRIAGQPFVVSQQGK